MRFLLNSWLTGWRVRGERKIEWQRYVFLLSFSPCAPLPSSETSQRWRFMLNDILLFFFFFQECYFLLTDLKLSSLNMFFETCSCCTRYRSYPVPPRSISCVHFASSHQVEHEINVWLQNLDFYSWRGKLEIMYLRNKFFCFCIHVWEFWPNNLYLERFTIPKKIVKLTLKFWRCYLPFTSAIKLTNDY